MEVYQSNEEIFIFQSKYVQEILNFFCMNDCKSQPTSIAHGKLLHKDDGTPKVDGITYISLVGNLMFLTNTRHGITYIILSLVSSYMSDPFEHHLK